MDITPLGHSSFRIRGKSATVVTDPYDSAMVGLKFPRHITCDILTVSHQHNDHNATSQIEGQPFIISAPGEYEVKGVSVIGYTAYHDEEKGAKRGKNVMYRIEMDDVSLVHLGDLGSMLTTPEIDMLDGVDVLFIPVGGTVTIPVPNAVKLISDIEPSIVIPMHYRREGYNLQVFKDITPLSEFLKEMGKIGITPQSKLTLSKDKLPEEMQVVILE